jgi:hypothetical protein
LIRQAARGETNHAHSISRGRRDTG